MMNKYMIAEEKTRDQFFFQENNNTIYSTILYYNYSILLLLENYADVFQSALTHCNDNIT